MRIYCAPMKGSNMKVVILAGGFGTRLGEETITKPKPMVEIGGKPILWHIMKNYAHFGHNEFIIALGYKADYIKRYFADYAALGGNLSLDMRHGNMEITRRQHDEWLVHLEDTGLDSGTGGRIKKLKKLIGNEPFLMTYGDGVSDIPLDKLIEAHKRSGKLATLSAVHPPSRFGGLAIDEGGNVSDFNEKPHGAEGWINGGFMVLQPETLDMISGAESSFEYEVLTELAQKNQLNAYKHSGFWQCMDTPRDLKYLESLWNESKAPWKQW